MSLRAFTVAILLVTTSPMVIAQQSRELFKQALSAGQRSNSIEQRWYIAEEVALAQARHGFYDDALATMSLTGESQALLFADIVVARAKNGDVAGAGNMIGLAPSSEAKWWASREIALLMVAQEDYEGARRTAATIPLLHQQVVLREIGLKRVQSGDLQGALEIWKEMFQGEGDGILVAVAEQLEKRGAHDKATELVSKITDQVILRELAQRQVPEQSRRFENSCDLAWQEADSGKAEQALNRLKENQCDCLTRYFVQEQMGLVEQASLSLQGCATQPRYQANVSPGMAKLASLAANKGDIPLALRLSEKVLGSSADYEEEYLEVALRDIARNWAMKEPDAALKWAESRKEGLLHSMALLGVAEASR